MLKKNRSNIIVPNEIEQEIVPMHGLSRPYQGFSYHNTAEILRDILRQENIEKIFLVGMSMGGYPSQHFASIYPDMVKGFIALDTTPLGLIYYSKSDLWWLKQVVPMAECFPAHILKVSMACCRKKRQYRKSKNILQGMGKTNRLSSPLHKRSEAFFKWGQSRAGK